MSTSAVAVGHWAGLKNALQRCRAECRQRRYYAAAATEMKYPSLQPHWRVPPAGFRPSQAIKQNRFEKGLKRIPVQPAIPSSYKACKDPVRKVYEDQLQNLDPTGARTWLFSRANDERVAPGDVLLVRLKTGDPFSGVCLNIRRPHCKIDTAILLRTHLTRVPVEMWFKIYSPNVEGIELVKRKEKRARRAKLYYMRKPRHDQGNVDNIVRQYLRTRLGVQMGSASSKGTTAAAAGKRKSK